MLVRARSARSEVLVLRGDAGCGKSALLDYVSDRAAGFRVARIWGVESEMELAFAGLHQLCGPMLDRLERIPAPQQQALRVAFGQRLAPVPDRLLIGLAVLNLLAEAAEDRPLACLVDDVQWLDHASVQALTFTARRLTAEPIAVVFATREPPDAAPDLTGLPDLAIKELSDDDARRVLIAALHVPLDEQVRDRIVAEAHGNPLALLELTRGRTAAELAGGFGLPDAQPVEGRIADSTLRRLQSLSRQTQLLLLTAAAEPVGDLSLLWRAAQRLGVSPAAAAPAETAGLLEVGVQVRFHHPLVRSAVYQAAPDGDRRAVHRALAEATDSEVDPDRRAWHLAHAAAGADEAVALDLERSADRARVRGGFAAAAAFLHQAVQLTPEPQQRAGRSLAAAQAKLRAGALDSALGLLAAAEAGPLDDLQRAQVHMVQAQIAYAQSRGSDAPPLLLKAAQRLEPLDAMLARDTHLEALSAAQFAGRLGLGGGVLEAAKAARAAPRPGLQPRESDLLLDAVATLITSGHHTAAPLVKSALGAFRSHDLTAEDGLRWLWLACRTAIDVWDYDTWDVLSQRLLELARDLGALGALPLALTLRMGFHLYAGDLAAVASLSEEADAITEATRSQLAPYGNLLIAAWQGHEVEALPFIQTTTRQVVERGEGLGLTAAQWATAVLYNGLGRFDDALTAAARASERREDLGFSHWSLAELVEAASLSGDAAAATDAFHLLTRTTRGIATEWGLGIETRSHALISQGHPAEVLYRKAIARLDRARVRVELARAHLLYGEWLRREGRRTDARAQLRTAHHMFSAMGIEAFASRAARELLTTGENVRRRTIGTTTELTAQEANIAHLARDGLSNPEIGARLFLSPRTVEWHLRKVFTKLDINARTELGAALPARARMSTSRWNPKRTDRGQPAHARLGG